MNKIIGIIFIMSTLLGCFIEIENRVGTEAEFAKMAVSKSQVPPYEMVWIKGGSFNMGATVLGLYEREYPPHQVEVDGFWIDIHEVTNKQYLNFIEATGYITVAERKVDWEELKKQLPPDTPKPADSMLQPGALVFNATTGSVDLNNPGNWWFWTIGADWRHPQGPGSDIANIMNHPVVQIAHEDAIAYCEWAGKRLPTEAEWEFAAKGGLQGKKYTWGDEDPVNISNLANIYHGDFPYNNTVLDHHEGAAPVMQYQSNGYKLYDMAGNVWEWCSDLFNEHYYKGLQHKLCKNPKGAEKSYNPRDPYAIERVTKGGSYLCHVSYCFNYRPSSREGTAEDTGMSHLGFRCVKDG